MSSDRGTVATAQAGPAMAPTAEAAARVKAMTSPDHAPSRMVIVAYQTGAIAQRGIEF